MHLYLLAPFCLLVFMEISHAGIASKLCCCFSTKKSVDVQDCYEKPSVDWKLNIERLQLPAAYLPSPYFDEVKPVITSKDTTPFMKCFIQWLSEIDTSTDKIFKEKPDLAEKNKEKLLYDQRRARAFLEGLQEKQGETVETEEIVNAAIPFAQLAFDLRELADRPIEILNEADDMRSQSIEKNSQ